MTKDNIGQIDNMDELIIVLKNCVKFAGNNECPVHYDSTCVAKTEIRQKLEECVKFIEEAIPRTREVVRSRYY